MPNMQAGLLGNLAVSALISVIFQWLFGTNFSFLILIAVFSISFLTTTILDILSRDVADSHTIRSAFDQYIALNFLDLLGWIAYKRLLKDTKNIQKTQTKTLVSFLRANSSTEYGKRYHSAVVKNPEDYRRQFPLTTYADYGEYVQRMQNGEREILTAQQPIVFAVTSGTSGRSSVLPFVRKQRAVFFFRGITVMSHVMMKFFPQTKCLRKGVKFFYSPRWRTSAAGIPVGPNSSSPTSTKSILHLYTTPKAGFDISSEPDALYAHLLFALLDRELGLIEANFASLVYAAFQFLEANKDDLISDIRRGKLKADLNVSLETRMELERILMPNEKRAREVADAFIDGCVGVARRLWPKMALVLCVDSGAFANYAQILRDKYCEGIPLYSPLYAATEGLIGLNIWPPQQPSRYLLVPSAMFFEFIPVKRMDEPQPETILLHQVEMNETYEVVLTNASGLCRYRFGDVVRVTEFVNQCPVVEFLYRKGQLLSVRGEKTSEDTLYDAVNTTMKSFSIPVEMVDYTTCESVLLRETDDTDHSYKSPFYGVFVELTDIETVLEKCAPQDFARKIDESMQVSSYVYKSFRTNSAIGIPVIYFLRPGTFSAFRTFLLSASDASANQIKIPRVLKNAEHVRFLLSRVI